MNGNVGSGTVAELLTDGADLVRTPTLHVFDLYTDHDDADAPVTHGEPGDTPGRIGLHGDYTVSRKGDGFTMSVTNSSVEQDVTASFELPEAIREITRAQYQHGETLDAHNTFRRPDAVRLADFAGYRVDGARLEVTLPPRSVTTLRLTCGEAR